VQLPLEVVVVFAFADTARSAGGEQVLHPLERLGGNERFVHAAVLDAVPLDDADVGLIAEND
jgi:hypothetical protein